MPYHLSVPRKTLRHSYNLQCIQLKHLEHHYSQKCSRLAAWCGKEKHNHTVGLIACWLLTGALPILYFSRAYTSSGYAIDFSKSILTNCPLSKTWTKQPKYYHCRNTSRYTDIQQTPCTLFTCDGQLIGSATPLATNSTSSRTLANHKAIDSHAHVARLINK